MGHHLGDPVPLSTASAETENWRNFINSVTTNPIYSFSFPVADMEAALSYAVNGVRVYLGITAAGAYNAFLVPIDGSGNDILESTDGTLIFDNALPCPSCCGETNVLNTTIPSKPPHRDHGHGRNDGDDRRE